MAITLPCYKNSFHYQPYQFRYGYMSFYVCIKSLKLKLLFDFLKKYTPNYPFSELFVNCSISPFVLFDNILSFLFIFHQRNHTLQYLSKIRFYIYNDS